MNVANISGGRTSMFMGIELQKRGFDGIYCFQNTGMETPETIEFLRRAPFPLVVLQYMDKPPFFTVETLYSMNKTGEPFKQLCRKRRAIPNMSKRFCTQEMKILTVRRYMKSLKINKWQSYLGIRACEPDRVTTITENYRKRNGKRVVVTPHFPLADWGITARTVGDFWRNTDWDLKMPMLPNGKTICGNCVGCFHKSEAELAMTLQLYPDLYAIMEALEKEIGRTFRNYSLAEFREFVEKDLQFDFSMANDVYCTDENGSCGD